MEEEQIPDEKTEKDIKKSEEESKNRSNGLKFIIGSFLVCICVGALIFIVVGAFFVLTPHGEERLEKVSVGGLLFNIQPKFSLNSTEENEDAFVNSYIYDSGSTGNSRRNADYINIYVYKNKSVQQVLSDLSAETAGWNLTNDSYGNYSVHMLKKEFHSQKYFIFEKEGKTVTIYSNYNYLKEDLLLRMIN